MKYIYSLSAQSPSVFPHTSASTHPVPSHILSVRRPVWLPRGCYRMNRSYVGQIPEESKLQSRLIGGRHHGARCTVFRRVYGHECMDSIPKSRSAACWFRPTESGRLWSMPGLYVWGYFCLEPLLTVKSLSTDEIAAQTRLREHVRVVFYQ